MSGITLGQTTETVTTAPKHHFFVHTYPTSLIFGDVSLGIEHQYKKRWAHEFSFYLRTFETKDLYDKGYRFDYLIKYYFVSRQKFRLSSNISFMQKDIYFENKEVSHYFIMTDLHPTPADGPYMITREDRQLRVFGWGAGLSCNLRVFRKFYVGSDLTLYITSGERRRSENELLYTSVDLNERPYNEKKIPSYKVERAGGLDIMLRVKLSYLLHASH